MPPVAGVSGAASGSTDKVSEAIFAHPARAGIPSGGDAAGLLDAGIVLALDCTPGWLYGDGQ
jgi:hypothetical protein